MLTRMAHALRSGTMSGTPTGNWEALQTHLAAANVIHRVTRDVDRYGRGARRRQIGVEMKPTTMGLSIIDQIINLFARLIGAEERLAPVPVPVRTKPSSRVPIRVEHR